MDTDFLRLSHNRRVWEVAFAGRTLTIAARKRLPIPNLPSQWGGSAVHEKTPTIRTLAQRGYRNQADSTRLESGSDSYITNGYNK
jgi:hypothetical protein